MGKLVVGFIVLAIVVAAGHDTWKDKKAGESCGYDPGEISEPWHADHEAAQTNS